MTTTYALYGRHLLACIKQFAILCMLVFVTGLLPVNAQRPVYGKMSPLVRRLSLMEQVQQASCPSQQEPTKGGGRRQPTTKDGRSIIAFVQTTGDTGVLTTYGCEVLARWDDLSIARIPLQRLSALSRDSRVLRIEAGAPCEAQLDTTTIIHHVTPLYEGTNLPASYTGKGVVVGLQDIGFDLTHPTFYNKEGTEYRVSRFWDHLSAEREGSSLPVGQEYTTPEAVLRYAHSRDGYMQWHGTHTAGIAAGSGGGTPYRGIAYESDICLVSNTVTSDTVFIAPEDRGLYTSAVDALGFKYIFDYAQSQGKPCVVSFSEGSRQDFGDESRLFHEVISRMVGPGRILVTSAGNESTGKSYFRKPAGTTRMGTFLYSGGNELLVNMLSGGEFSLHFHVYDGGKETVFTRSSTEILADEDSLVIDTVDVGSRQYVVCWNAFTPDETYGDKTVYQFYVKGTEVLGRSQPVALSVTGDAEVEVFRTVGDFVENNLNSSFAAGERSHNILVPGSAPDAITVGALGYRSHFVRYDQTPFIVNAGNQGLLSSYSSTGPTPQGLLKPDVAASGTVISSISSFYDEKNGHSEWGIGFTDFNGRTYPWKVDCGTSMSTPVVAGIIALWLQANPRLTPDEVKNIFAATCTHPDESLSYPNNSYGYGAIDAEAGQRMVLATTGIVDVVLPDHVETTGLGSHQGAFNLLGQPVGSAYHGIIIRNGRKYHQK